jgi:purine-cytosine permease-like protein
MNKKIQDVTFTWNEGRYFDLWTLTHIISGIPLALIFLILESERFIAYSISISLFVLWEIFEKLFKIFETIENRLLDIVSATLGFAFIFEITKNLQRETFVALLTFSFVIWIVLCIIGWLDFKKREENK